MSILDMTGKAAVVTGAGQGVGRQLALTLAAHAQGLSSTIISWNVPTKSQGKSSMPAVKQSPSRRM